MARVGLVNLGNVALSELRPSDLLARPVAGLQPLEELGASNETTRRNNPTARSLLSLLRGRKRTVPIRKPSPVRVADLKSFPQAGYFGYWLGMAPDDSPLLLRDTGTQEIYALDWEEP